MTTKDAVTLTYSTMGSGGRCDWTQLREAVSEATTGSRDYAQPLRDDIYPGHEMVRGINHNSLDRIVTAFVDAALTTPPAPRMGDGVARVAIARVIALHGLGTESGISHRGPPNTSWTVEEWENRILRCVPGRVERQCYELADAILDLLAGGGK